MITTQYSSTIVIFIMSSSVVQLFLLALISSVTTDEVTGSISRNIAKPGQFPFLASIRIKNVHICGGSIINSQFILTAGHCVREANRAINDVTVVTGSVQLSRGGFISNVANMNSVTQNGKDLDTDIGLIKLTIPLEYNFYTRSIRYSISNVDLPDDDFGTVIGWGSTSTDLTAANDNLQYMSAYITNASCSAFTETNHVVCTNNGPTSGVCYGDSGSPLVYNDKVIGVVSRAVLCAKGLPDVYSSPAYNIDFIRYMINTA